MPVQTDRRGSVLLIRLNRPEVHNASNLEMKQCLLAALTQAQQDRQLKTLILTGNGRSFCAGGDLKEKLQLDEDAIDRALGLQQTICLTLRALDIVTIAAVSGHALGGGLEMALNCDIRIAGPDARFAAPVGRNASLSTGGLHYRLGRAVGASWAADLILTGRSIGADTACEIGLVTRVSSSPVDEALAIAAGLEEQAAESARLGKHLLQVGEEASQLITMQAEHRLCLRL